MKTYVYTNPYAGYVVYEVDESGTYYHAETPVQVRNVLNNAIQERYRVRLWLGNPDTGLPWNEEYDVIGYVSRSLGPAQVPILLANASSNSGGHILDHHILRIVKIQDRRVLYEVSNWQMPVYWTKAVEPSDRLTGYTTMVFDDEDVNVANFRSKAKALRWIAFMRGERFTK